MSYGEAGESVLMVKRREVPNGAKCRAAQCPNGAKCQTARGTERRALRRHDVRSDASGGRVRSGHAVQRVPAASDHELHGDRREEQSHDARHDANPGFAEARDQPLADAKHEPAMAIVTRTAAVTASLSGRAPAWPASTITVETHQDPRASASRAA